MKGALKRAGYPASMWRDRPTSPIRRHLERAGGRVISLNRYRPAEGGHYAECPRCGDPYGVSVERGEERWRSLCGCGPAGELDTYDLMILLYDPAA